MVNPALGASRVRMMVIVRAKVNAIFHYQPELRSEREREREREAPIMSRMRTRVW